MYDKIFLMDDKKSLSERDIITKYIIPAIKQSGWDTQKQIREEVTFTAGRIIVNGRQVKRGERKRADIILYYKYNIPIAIERSRSGHGIHVWIFFEKNIKAMFARKM